MTTEYKCERLGEMIFACIACLERTQRNHDKMLEFIKEIAFNPYEDNTYEDDARILLKEIGEL